MTILTEADRNRADAKLERWRADLLDYDAALLDTIGHTREADFKRQDAAWRRTHADLLTAFQLAADAHGPGSAETRAAYAALDAARSNWRKMKLSSGAPQIAAGVGDGFDEPDIDTLTSEG